MIMVKYYYPKFSILMANHNRGQYIGEAIQSVFSQTYKNWELVIVDDCSTDNSLAVIKPFLKDNRVKLIINKRNLGCGAAKKKCAENASGEILGILDSDDILEQNVLATIIKIYQNNYNCGVVYTTHYECDKYLNVKRISPWVNKLKKGETNLKVNRTSQFLTFSKIIYKKTEGFDPLFRVAEDKDLIYKLEEVTELCFVNKPLYYYRIHKEGVASFGWHSQRARLFEYIAKYNAYQRRLGTNLPNYTKSEIADLMYEGFIRSLVLFKAKKAFFFFLKAWQLNPNIFCVIRVLFSKLFKKRKLK